METRHFTSAEEAATHWALAVLDNLSEEESCQGVEMTARLSGSLARHLARCVLVAHAADSVDVEASPYQREAINQTMHLALNTIELNKFVREHKKTATLLYAMALGMTLANIFALTL